MANQKNILRVGISSLQELDQKVKAFRMMNLNVKKRRYIISREDILNDSGAYIVKKGEDIDIAKVKFMQRSFKPDYIIKTFQPDEGIVIVSDMSEPSAKKFSDDLYNSILRLGGGAYEAFIDRVNSFQELSTLLSKALFPKMLVIGYISLEKLEAEMKFFQEIKRMDPFIRMLEVNHTLIKPIPLISKVHNVVVSADDQESWKGLLLTIVKEYTKSYGIEER